MMVTAVVVVPPMACAKSWMLGSCPLVEAFENRCGAHGWLAALVLPSDVACWAAVC